MFKQTLFLVSLTVFNSSFAYEVLDQNVRNPAQVELGGFTNTPLQPAPHEQWHIHDPRRTQPEVKSPQYDGVIVPAPDNAKVIFDGKSLKNLTNQKWKIKNGAMIASRGYQITKESFGDMHLHLEWMVPLGLEGFSQKQGNSGVFLMGLYEIQVLNCWANRTYPDGMTGALYGQKPPMFNACRKPGEWQSYDIHFKAPTFDGKDLVSPATVTVYLNNVVIQDQATFRGPTRYRQLTSYSAHGAKPLKLQFHGNPVHYRNIWVAPLPK